MSTVIEQAIGPDAATAQEIAIEGYLYLYPLVLMDVTRRQLTNVARAGDAPFRAPPNSFIHFPAFPPAGFREVVRPNFDTLYSSAFLDLTGGPMLVSVPATDLYYLMPMLDMWTHAFACPGSRTTGNEPVDFALCLPGWQGELPDGVRRYDAPTPVVWIIGRTQASVETYDVVRAFQGGIELTPLAHWGGKQPEVVGTVDPAVDNETAPLRQVAALDAEAFWRYAADLTATHPAHPEDYPVLDRLARIGFVPGRRFELTDIPEPIRTALETAPSAALELMRANETRIGREVNGWRITTTNIGTYATDYAQRATIALTGLGANPPAEAIYPTTFFDATGKPFDGTNRYVWHMTPDDVPPVRGFWSLTLYDDEGFQVANQLNRFAIGDRDHLEFNADGSLDIYIQHQEPGGGSSNWLPAPEGSFNLAARLYWPKPQVLDGSWVPAPVAKVG